MSNLPEPYRPAFHFSPAKAWLNDPNGLVYYQGEYHLFYQYHPESTVWGPMHWGHAVSPDLIHWQELPIALYPDALGTIFSGSCVIDHHNTAGFGQEAMIAIFTHDTKGLQQQSIAYSIDKGRSWTKYQGNPVLPPPLHSSKDFRDPKVFWYGSPEQGHWVMSLAVGLCIQFYTSGDLKTWAFASEFGLSQGATGGVWETPDLFELAIEGSDQKRWVLSVAVGDDAPAGGSGQQYFVGHFDGKSFHNDNDNAVTLWADYGADFYAGQSWENIQHKRIWIGWMNNWRYGRHTPSKAFRGSMTLPRELSLIETAEGLRLKQELLPAFRKLRDQHWSLEDAQIASASKLLEGISGDCLEFDLVFKASSNVQEIGLHLRVGDTTQTTIGYEPGKQQLFFDRARSGQTTFHEDYSQRHIASLSPRADGSIRLQVILDCASVEVLANDGRVVMTEQIFPHTGHGLQLYSRGGDTLLTSLDIWRLQSIA